MKWTIRFWLRDIKCALGFHYSWCEDRESKRTWCNNCKEPKYEHTFLNEVMNWMGAFGIGLLLGVAIILSL